MTHSHPEELALAGLRILITRAASQSDELATKLEPFGAIAISKPLIEIGPPDSWETLDSAITHLESFDWIVFASKNAVAKFASRLHHHHINLAARNHVAAIGPSTTKAVIAEGWTVSFQPDEFIAEGLIRQFPGYPELSGKRILWPRTTIGRLLLAEELQKAGACVEIAQCYKTVTPTDIRKTGEEIVQLMQNHAVDIITLASAQTAKNLALALDGLENSDLINNIPIVTIGPETTRALLGSFPGARIFQAHEYTMDGIIDCLCNIASTQQIRASLRADRPDQSES